MSRPLCSPSPAYPMPTSLIETTIALSLAVLLLIGTAVALAVRMRRARAEHRASCGRGARSVIDLRTR